MAIDPVLVRRDSEPMIQRMAVLAGVLAAVNIAVALMAIYYVEGSGPADPRHRDSYFVHPRAIGQLTTLIFAQALANGIALLPWRSTRQVGAGILVGSVLMAGVTFLFAVGQALSRSQ